MTARTMLYLEADQLRALKDRARSEGVSVTELVRRLVRQYLTEGTRQEIVPETWNRLVAIGASGQSGISERHDQALGEALRREHLR